MKDDDDDGNDTEVQLLGFWHFAPFHTGNGRVLRPHTSTNLARKAGVEAFHTHGLLTLFHAVPGSSDKSF